MEAFVNWLIELLCWAFAILLVPVTLWLLYRRECKKYGKEYTGERARRY